jgi:spore germination cell wall hydrolase CwlJ-like protein
MKYLNYAHDHLNNFLIAIALLIVVWMQTVPDGPPIAYPSAREMSWLVRVAAGEARGQRDDLELAGICSVALNRMRLGVWGPNLETVVRAPHQFSPLNGEDVNRAVILAPGFEQTRAYKRVETICTMTVHGRLERRFGDPVRGSDHFWSGKIRPYWAKNSRNIVTIGEFHFVRLFRQRSSKMHRIVALTAHEKNANSNIRLRQ